MISVAVAGTSAQPMLRPTPAGSEAASDDCAKAFCRSHALAHGFLLAARNQDQELVASPPEDVVGLADVADQEHRDALEDAVPGLVAEACR